MKTKPPSWISRLLRLWFGLCPWCGSQDIDVGGEGKGWCWHCGDYPTFHRDLRKK